MRTRRIERSPNGPLVVRRSRAACYRVIMNKRGLAAMFVIAWLACACGAKTALREPLARATSDGAVDGGQLDTDADDDSAAADVVGAEPFAWDVIDVARRDAIADVVGRTVDVIETCRPSCVDRACGSDGCGGSCGACAPGLFCSADRRCGSCPEGAACNTGNACETGVIRCLGLEQQCVRATLSPAGARCLGGTCDGRGNCSAIAPAFLLIVDSSGSMRVNDAGPNACGFEPRRINSVACGLFELGRRTQNALWAMQTFALRCANSEPRLQGGSGFGCGASGCEYRFPSATPAPNPMANGGYPFPFYGCDDGGTLWIPFSSRANQALSVWGDGVFSSCDNNVALGQLGGPDFVYSTNVWQEMPSRLTPLAGSLRYAALYLGDHLREHRSPYVRFDGTGDVDPLGHQRAMNVILLTDGDECCSSSGGSDCELSSMHTGAAFNARNIGCLRVDLDRSGTIDDPLAPDHPNPALRGRYESNIDLNNDGDCYDPGEQRAYRTRVFVMAFGTTVSSSRVEAIAEAGGSPLRRVGTTTQRGYYIRAAADFAQTIDALITASITAP